VSENWNPNCAGCGKKVTDLDVLKYGNWCENCYVVNKGNIEQRIECGKENIRRRYETEKCKREVP